MDFNEWETLVGLVRKQLNELRTAQAENQRAAVTAKEVLQEARENLVALLEQAADPKEASYRLALATRVLAADKQVGTLWLGSDGSLIGHHGSALRHLGFDPASNSLRSDFLFDDSGLIAEGQLPWQRCLRGEDFPEIVSLFLKHPNNSEEAYLYCTAVPLRVSGELIGALGLFRDKTEIVTAARFIRDMCEAAEKQLSSIRSAHMGLRLFSDQLRTITGDTPVQDRRVLIVDDIPVNQQLLLMRLRKFGVDAEVANNGAEAVDRCKKQQYALVLMDLDMPKLNGYEATAAIRKIDADTGLHTPIVALSSFDRECDKKQCAENEMDDFVSKGDHMGRLRALVDKFVLAKEGEVKLQINAPVPDKKRLDEGWLRETFGDDCENVLSLFCGSVAMLLNCLEFALKEENLREVTHFAYSLRGPCGIVGASTMADHAAQLVVDAEKGKWSEAARKFTSLQQMFYQYQESAQRTVAASA